MITFDFDYYKPGSTEEAISVYTQLTGEGKNVIYYAGGTEIISLAKKGRAYFDAVIDIKEIPALNVLEFQGDKLVIGAAVCLTKISDSGLFPLLGSVCRRVADRTARNKITLGGNICGKIPYREAILPLLLTDSEINIAGASGTKLLPLADVFDKGLKLETGGLLVQAIINKEYLNLPYANIKKTRQEKMGYPLVTAATLDTAKYIRVAFSGLCPFPFRSQQIEKDFNDGTASIEQKQSNVVKHLPEPPVSDILGSTGYREFLVKNILSEITVQLGGVKC